MGEEVTVIIQTFCSSYIKTMVQAHCQHRMFSKVFFEQQSWICANIVITSYPDSCEQGQILLCGLLLQVLQCIRLCENSVCGGRITQIQPTQIEQELWVLALLHNLMDTIIECLLCIKHCAMCFINVISFSSQSNALAVETVAPLYN